jgi:ankyrin repeat protein
VSGLDAFTMAVSERHHEVVKVLLEHGADVNNLSGPYPRGSGMNPMPPLYNAISVDSVETAKVLIRYGADVNGWCVDSRGCNHPLIYHAVMQNASEEMFRLLIDNGVIVHATAPGLGQAALKMALQKSKNPKIIEMKKSADGRTGF